jgi:hypothetical protein
LLLELQKHEAVGVKFLTLILGKIVSMLLSHGAILRVLSRVAQHILGQHVAQFGWEGAVQLSEQFRTEFAKLLDCLVIFNKQHIYSAASGVTVDVNKIQQLKSRCRATGLQLAFMMDSDSPMAFAYHYHNDGSFRVIQDFATAGQQQAVGKGVCELLALRQALQTFTRMALALVDSYFGKTAPRVPVMPKAATQQLKRQRA